MLGETGRSACRSSVGSEARCVWCGLVRLGSDRLPVERRSGPPISWDDLMHFHQAMSRSDPGSIDPVSDARRSPAEQERHAA